MKILNLTPVTLNLTDIGSQRNEGTQGRKLNQGRYIDSGLTGNPPTPDPTKAVQLVETDAVLLSAAFGQIDAAVAKGAISVISVGEDIEATVTTSKTSPTITQIFYDDYVFGRPVNLIGLKVTLNAAIAGIETAHFLFKRNNVPIGDAQMAHADGAVHTFDLTDPLVITNGNTFDGDDKLDLVLGPGTTLTGITSITVLLTYGYADNASLVRVYPATIPSGRDNVAYTATVNGSGGVSPYTFAVTAGALPVGLSLDPSTGVISGTATTPDPAVTFTIEATDALGVKGSREYTVTINVAIILVLPAASGTTFDGPVGTAQSHMITASGGRAPYTFAVTPASIGDTGLPPGMSLAAGGALTGTPTTAGHYNYAVTATDSDPTPGANTGSTDYIDVIIYLALDDTLPDGTASVVYGGGVAAVVATGGTPAYSYAVTAGALPDGLTLHGATGVIDGTPTVADTFTFTITATDSAGVPNTGTREYTIIIAA